MINRILCLLALPFLHNFIIADVSQLVSTVGAAAPLFGYQEKDEQYKKINEKIQAFSAALGAAIQKLQSESTFIRDQIKKLESEQLTTSDSEHIMKLLGIYRELDQMIKDMLQTYDDVNTVMYDYKKMIEKSIQDPHLESFKKEYKLHKRTPSNVHDLLSFHQTIQSLETRLNQLADQKKNIDTEVETYYRAAKAAKKLYQELDGQLQKTREMAATKNDMQLAKEEELLLLRMQLAQLKEQSSKLKNEYFEYRLLIISHQLFVARTQLQMLRQHVQNIKYNIHVTERDIIDSQEKLQNEKIKNFAEKDALRIAREDALREKSVHEQMLEQMSLSYKMEPLLPEDWAREIEETAISYRHFVEIGWLSSHVRALDIARQFIEASLVLLDTKLENSNMLLSVMETFNRLVTRRFVTESKLLEDKKKYEEIIAANRIQVTLYTEKIEAVTKELKVRKKIHDILALVDQKIAALNTTIFQEQKPMFEEVRYFVRMAIEEEKKYTDTLSKLSEAYMSVIAELENITRLANFIINELRSSTIWYRPAYAITWSGITNAIPEILDFSKDVILYLSYTGFGYFFKKLNAETNSAFLLFLFILKILLVIAILFLYRYFSAIFCRYCFEKNDYKTPGMRRLFLFVAVIFQIISEHLYGLGTVIILFLFAYLLSDVYVFTTLYVLLIPYSVYFVWSAFRSFKLYNDTCNYFLIPQELSEQFATVGSFLSGTTISIMLFRQAFILSGFAPDSEVPTILLALNFIILQLSLISLISKEHIAEILPEGTAFWQGIRSLIDSYFYIILLLVSAVIVMSNPYIGFGRLVLYLLIRVVYITLIVRFVLFFHSIVKTGSSHLLFVQEAGIIKERFDHAKTIFGFVMIISFLLFAFVGGVIIAKSLGYPIEFHDIFLLLYEPIVYVGVNNPISGFSILQIIGFVLIGFLFSYALEQFVFTKIFDLLLVEIGIQHTIVRITQYVVVIFALFIGFQNVGLGQIIGYAFTALALSIGWYIKEPISDFFAYFIILVQRTIKIGDFIRLEGDIEGVVRKITPRSVILRRRNSATLLIPNSIMVQRVVANWNYIRSFVAFDDMRITIQYHENPAFVRNLLLQVLNNHPRILKTPKPIVFLDQFGEHGYIFMIRGFLSSTYTLDMWEIASEVRLAIIQTLREHNVQIAIPVRFVTQSPITLQKNGTMTQEEIKFPEQKVE